MPQLKKPFLHLPVVNVKKVPNPDFDQAKAQAAKAEGVPYDVEAELLKIESFTMRIRSGEVIAYNAVTEAPEGSEILTTIYTENPKMPQLFSTLSASDIDAAILAAERA